MCASLVLTRTDPVRHLCIRRYTSTGFAAAVTAQIVSLGVPRPAETLRGRTLQNGGSSRICHRSAGHAARAASGLGYGPQSTAAGA